MNVNTEVEDIGTVLSISIMKSLVCLAAILIICEAAYPHLSLLRALAREDSGVSLLDFPEYSEKCSDDALRECISCSEAKLCLPNGRPIAKVNCSSYSPSMPFCNPEDGLCVANAPSGCGDTLENSFDCPPQDGVYPDPSDCTQFHYCVNSEVITVKCPTNNVYDHILGTCKLRRWPADCVKFTCTNKEGKDIIYPKDDRIWATCAGGNAYIMGRCEDYERYDVAQRKCNRVCRVVENQPIKGVCNSYVRCAEIGNGKLEPVAFPCPPNQGFDEESKQCSSKVSCSKTEENTAKDENQKQTELSRIINNSGDNNVNNNVENGNDSVDGNLVNGNNNGNNLNSQNIASGNQGRAIISRINNSGNDNSKNNVVNGQDNTNGNLVNGNDNFENTNTGNVGSGNQNGPLLRINNSGNDNADNDVTNGDDNTNGNLVNGNNNSDNTNTGNVGSGNQKEPLFRINNSGNDNTNNDVTNGNDDTNGNIVNGSNNSENRGKFTSRIINNSGNSNNGNSITNGDDDVNGNLINGNNNWNNENSGNIESGDKDGPSSRIINGSGNNNTNQSILNGNDNTNGNVINGNDNDNNENSNNVGNIHEIGQESTSSGLEQNEVGNFTKGNDDDDDQESKNPPNFIAWFKNLIKWFKEKLGIVLE